MKKEKLSFKKQTIVKLSAGERKSKRDNTSTTEIYVTGTTTLRRILT